MNQMQVMYLNVVDLIECVLSSSVRKDLEERLCATYRAGQLTSMYNFELLVLEILWEQQTKT